MTLKEVTAKLREIKFTPVTTEYWNWLKGWNDSEALVMCVAMGPWKQPRRMKIAEEVLTKLYRRDLINVSLDEFPWYPLDWQNKFIRHTISYCQDNEIFFTDAVTDIHWYNLKTFYENIIGTKYGTKVISLFVRDHLEIPAFPIDRWIKRWLVTNGLPADEGLIVAGCKEAGINPNDLDRWIMTESDFSGNPKPERNT